MVVTGAPLKYILVNVTPLCREIGSYLSHVEFQDEKMEKSVEMGGSRDCHNELLKYACSIVLNSIQW